MGRNALQSFLWGSRAKLGYLLCASLLLLFTMLGARDIWTQEHRWAEIVYGMFYRQDFLHPFIGTITYYDKPLLSYWLIALMAKLTGSFTEATLRLPSAFSGLLAIFSIYRLGCMLKDKELGFLSGWLLLTTFYFIFWARTGSADMLNLAGSLFAIMWYFAKKDQAGFLDYCIFFLVLALTSLCKGLVGAVIPLIVVFIDSLMHKSFSKHLCPNFFIGMVLSVIVYLLPFIASLYYQDDHYQQNGLYLVYRENILRYIKPFDHQGPVYIYLIYLPIYLMPWTLLFIPALLSLKTRYKNLTLNSKWIVWSMLGLFLFFTLSGSRRSYYILPVVPFAILFIADWILANDRQNNFLHGKKLTLNLLISTFLLLFLYWAILQPLYYKHAGEKAFAKELKTAATLLKPWENWDFVLLNADTKLNFYLRLKPTTLSYDLRNAESLEIVKKLLLDSPNMPNTIFITRKNYLPLIGKYLTHDKVIFTSSDKLSRWFGQDNHSIAFVPK